MAMVRVIFKVGVNGKKLITPKNPKSLVIEMIHHQNVKSLGLPSGKKLMMV